MQRFAEQLTLMFQGSKLQTKFPDAKYKRVEKVEADLLSELCFSSSKIVVQRTKSRDSADLSSLVTYWIIVDRGFSCAQITAESEREFRACNSSRQQYPDS